MVWRRSDKFCADFRENLRVVGVSILSVISAAVGFTAVDCVIAVACVPVIASIPAVNGVPVVLTVSGLPASAGFPGVIGVSAVAVIPAVAGDPAVADVPAFAGVLAVDGVLAVASFPADPGVPFLLSDYRQIEYWTWRIRETFGLSDIGSRPQPIGRLDIGLIKNCRLATYYTFISNTKNNQMKCLLYQYSLQRQLFSS